MEGASDRACGIGVAGFDVAGSLDDGISVGIPDVTEAGLCEGT